MSNSKIVWTRDLSTLELVDFNFNRTSTWCLYKASVYIMTTIGLDKKLLPDGALQSIYYRSLYVTFSGPFGFVVIPAF